MSQETSKWLNENVLVGFTKQRGTAWHYRASDQGDEPNHYVGAVPLEDVERRLFYWDARSFPVFINVPCDVADPEMGDVDEDGIAHKRIVLDDHQAIGRADTNQIFRVFRSGYAIHQYSDWLLDMVADLIQDDDLSIASAGLLKDGGVAWVSIELPDNLKTPSGFDIRPSLLATTSLNGTLATTYKQTATAVVCDNTLTWGLQSNGQVFRARHSKYSGFKMNDARNALDLVHIGGEDIMAEIEELAAMDVTKRQFDRIVNMMVPIPTIEASSQAGVTRAENKQASLQRLWIDDERVTPWAGTALGVVQTFNTFNHHVAGVDKTRAERNMTNNLSGKNDKNDGEVMSVLREVLVG